MGPWKLNCSRQQNKWILQMTLALLVALPCASHASIGDEVGRFLGDASAGIADEFMRVVAAAENAARAVIGEADKATQARLNQVEGIVKSTIHDIDNLADKHEDKVDRILRDRISQIQTLEKAFFADINQAIRNLECTIGRNLKDDLNVALGGFGRFLDTNTIEISPIIPVKKGFWSMLFGGSDTKKIKITRSNQYGYKQIQRYYLDHLKHVDDDTPVDTILATYRTLAAVAFSTMCHYEGNEQSYIRDYVFYRSKHAEWHALWPNIEFQDPFEILN